MTRITRTLVVFFRSPIRVVREIRIRFFVSIHDFWDSLVL